MTETRLPIRLDEATGSILNAFRSPPRDPGVRVFQRVTHLNEA